MDTRSTEIVTEIGRIQKSLTSPLRKQWYRNVAAHVIEQSEIIEQQQQAIHGNSGRQTSPA